MAREITVDAGKVAVVDDSDFDWASRYVWSLTWDGYVVRQTASRPYRMHRELLGVTDPKIRVDHINGDRADNRRQNLRVCNDRQNLRNSSAHRDSTSAFKGVSWSSARSKWKAAIRLAGGDCYLGLYTNERQAASANDTAALAHFGSFAKLKFPVPLLDEPVGLDIPATQLLVKVVTATDRFLASINKS